MNEWLAVWPCVYYFSSPLISKISNLFFGHNSGGFFCFCFFFRKKLLWCPLISLREWIIVFLKPSSICLINSISSGVSFSLCHSWQWFFSQMFGYSWLCRIFIFATIFPKYLYVGVLSLYGGLSLVSAGGGVGYIGRWDELADFLLDENILFGEERATRVFFFLSFPYSLL